MADGEASMSKESNAEKQIVQQLIAAFMQLSLAAKIGLVALILVVGVAIYAFNHHLSQTGRSDHGKHPESRTSDDSEPGGNGNIPPPAAAFPPGSKSVVFCVWNMENLFDDKDDHRLHVDEEFDRWFAHDPE